MAPLTRTAMQWKLTRWTLRKLGMAVWMSGSGQCDQRVQRIARLWDSPKRTCVHCLRES